MNGNRPMSGIALAALVILGLIFVGGLILGGCWAYPQYHVWEQTMEGKAELQRATSNRMIAVQEAEAKLEAASKLADAEVARARGVAKANEIIGQSLKDNESYLRWLWIEQLSQPKPGQTVIYVPTEANLPILEAHRLGVK